MTAFERVLDALHAHGGTVRTSGTGRASAQCPAHEDGTASLMVTGIKDRALLHCHAGCQIGDVLAALNLGMADLFDEPKPPRRMGILAHAVYRSDNGRETIRQAEPKEFRQANTDRPPQLYRLSKVRQAVAERRPVFVVEGEQDVHALETLGVTATCNPMGAGKWSKIDPSPLHGAKVLVIADQDDPGRRHAADIVASLTGHADVALFAPKSGKDAADHVAAGYGVADLVPVETTTAPAAGAVTVSLANVEPERVDWLWRGRLPRRKIVVLDGDPSVGKSTCAVDWSATVSTGGTWPDGTRCRRGPVLLLSAEDGLADTIRPRLDAADGDPANVHALTEIRYRDDNDQLCTRPPTLADLDQIERAVRATHAVLVVIDVLMAYLPGKVDSHRDQDVRVVLAGLAAMAERTGCCVLLLRHLNKSAGGSALYRGGGSIGIIGAARLGLLAAVDPDDENRRVLAATKSNLAAKPDALAYQLVDSPEHGCARVEWLGTSEHTAAALLAAPPDEDERTERDDAGDWLLDYLAANGREVPSGQIKKAAHGEGISERTLKRAKSKVRVGHHSTRTTPRHTYWTHPDFQSGQSGQDPQYTETVAQLAQGGPTEEIRGVRTPHVMPETLVGPPVPVPGHVAQLANGAVPRTEPGQGRCPTCGVETPLSRAGHQQQCNACSTNEREGRTA